VLGFSAFNIQYLQSGAAPFMNPLELFEKPQMLHAIIVHGPIFLALAGVPLLILSMIFWRQAAWRWASLIFYGVATLSAWISEETGEAARELVPPTISAEAGALLSRHASLGESVWVVTFGVFVLIALSFVNNMRFREVMLLLATAGAIASAAMVAGTAHMGGSLVYVYGIGTPYMHAPKPAAAVPTPPAPPAAVEPAVVDSAPAPVPVTPAETAPPTPETLPDPEPEVALEPMDLAEPETPGETTPLASAIGEAPVAESPVPDPTTDDPSWLKIRPIDMAEAEQVSYADEVYPLLDDQCIWCHSDPDADSELDMSTVALMLKGGKKLGPALVPGQPDESNMIKYIRGIYQPRMPEDEPPLTEDQLHLLRMWIAAGAKEE
jgi:uncharacterized membrane protein